MDDKLYKDLKKTWQQLNESIMGEGRLTRAAVRHRKQIQPTAKTNWEEKGQQDYPNYMPPANEKERMAYDKGYIQSLNDFGKVENLPDASYEKIDVTPEEIAAMTEALNLPQLGAGSETEKKFYAQAKQFRPSDNQLGDFFEKKIPEDSLLYKLIKAYIDGRRRTSETWPKPKEPILAWAYENGWNDSDDEDGQRDRMSRPDYTMPYDDRKSDAAPGL